VPSTTPGRLFKGGFVPPRFHPDWSGVGESHREYHDDYYNSLPDGSSVYERMIWLSLVGGTGDHGKKAPPGFKCLLDAFPGTSPSSNKQNIWYPT
jgi:hypothetical protein